MPREPVQPIRPNTLPSLTLDLTSENLGLTFNRMTVWTNDFKLRMRMMGILIEATASKKSFIPFFTLR